MSTSPKEAASPPRVPKKVLESFQARKPKAISPTYQRMSESFSLYSSSFEASSPFKKSYSKRSISSGAPPPPPPPVELSDSGSFMIFSSSNPISCFLIFFIDPSTPSALSSASSKPPERLFFPFKSGSSNPKSAASFFAPSVTRETKACTYGIICVIKTLMISPKARFI